MIRVRNLEVVGGEPDAQALQVIHSQKYIMQGHARHFLDKVEAIITINQFREFEKLTTECKSWIKTELKEAQTALDYILSPSQKQAIMEDTQTLET